MIAEKILVVDDDEEICHFVEKTLNAEGYEAESVQSGKEAIRLVRKTRFNLVVLDNKLPDIEGIDLLTQLREIDSDLDIIIITAFASLETAIRALDNGAASYIVKPLDLREMIPKVARVIEKQRLVREKKQVERELEESGEKYRSLFENLPVGLAYHRIVFNKKGQPEDYEFLDVNEHFEALTGLNRTEILGKPASEVLSVLGKQEWISRFNTVVQTGVRSRFDQYSEMMGRWFSVTAYCPEDEFLVAAFTDITERKRSEQELTLEGERLQAIWELNQMSETSTDSLIEFAREQAVKLTGSKIGYVAFLNEEQNLLMRKSWSHSAMKECEVPKKNTIFPIAETGLWGEPIRRRKPIIINDYAAPNAMKNGLPEGHLEISRIMSIPVFDRDKIVATAGVANKESDYSSSDARQMTLLMQGMWTILQRRETEKALKESEEQFRRVFQDAGIGIVLVGPDDCILNSNRAMQDMMGYSSDELSQMQIQDLSHTEDMKVDHDTKLDAADKKLDRYQIEKRYIKKDGTILWGRLTVSFIRDPAGAEQLIVGMVEDITEAKNAEEDIRASEERFRSLFENAQVGIFRTSIEDGSVIECNEIGARILGYNSPDEVKAEYVASEHYVDPTSRPKMLDLLTKDGKFENFRAQLTKRDGSPIWLEYSARLFPKEGYLETVIQEISERMQTQEDLEKAAKKYQNLVEESMQGVAIYQDERIVYANPAFAETLSYSVEELLQLSPEDVRRLIHHEDRETIVSRLASIEAGLQFLPRIIFRFLSKTGVIRWVESYSRKTKHDGKNAIQIVAIDITERRVAEERMRTAAETANLHVDLMSHDIRNHLQAIVMATDILAHYETLPEVDQTHQLIVDSVKKSQTLIRKITATRDLFSVPLEETSLKKTLDESLHRFRESFPDVEINVEYAIDGSTIMADHFLENMLLNLLENAVLHNDSHVKRLWIVLKETNEGFEVSISDNGPGIDELKKDALFDPGRRFGGVGLHQSLRIAEKYLGKISVHDRVSDPDQGAEFRVWIPKSLGTSKIVR